MIEYICEFCNKKFKNRRAMGKHIQRKSLGECRNLYFKKYGDDRKNLPWNKPIKCLTEGCNKMIDPVLIKTGKCHYCATQDVVKNRKRNSKLTSNNPDFIVDGLVEWKCEFCGIIFLSKLRLDIHSRETECRDKFYKKYRIRGLFPWNYSKSKECPDCGNIIKKKSLYCKKCIQKHTFHKQISNKLYDKILETYTIFYKKEFYDYNLRTKIKKEQEVCPICLEKLKDLKRNVLHHIDYNKMNNDRFNLVFLCSSCHAKTNWKREYYFDFLYEFNNNLELRKNGDIQFNNLKLEKPKNISEESNNG